MNLTDDEVCAIYEISNNDRITIINYANPRELIIKYLSVILEDHSNLSIILYMKHRDSHLIDDIIERIDGDIAQRLRYSMTINNNNIYICSTFNLCRGMNINKIILFDDDYNIDAFGAILGVDDIIQFSEDKSGEMKIINNYIRL